MARPANDAHLVQLVRGELGRDPATRDLPRVNVSSCKRVVTLHGNLTGEQERTILRVARRVEGVREVVSKLRRASHGALRSAGIQHSVFSSPISWVSDGKEPELLEEEAECTEIMWLAAGRKQG